MGYFLCLLLVSFLSYAFTQCPSSSTVTISGKVNGLIDVPTGCSSFTWNVNYSDFDADGDPFPFVVQFAPKIGSTSAVYDDMIVYGRNSASDSWTKLATIDGSNTNINGKVNGEASSDFAITFEDDIGGDNTYGKVLRFRSLFMRFEYTQGKSSTAYTVLFKISDQIVGKDLDGDGFIYPTEDCCDTQRYCKRPLYVNIGAFNIPNNGINDAGSGSACSQDPDENYSCSTSTCNHLTGGCTPTSLAQALNLCQTTTENGKTWGVISSRIALADGTRSPCVEQYSVASEFTGNNNPVSYYKPGQNFVVLSSGYANANSLAPHFGCGKGKSLVPSQYINSPGSGHNGYLYDNSNGCGRQSSNDNYVNDASNLVVRLRAPTNANSFSFLIKFLSYEYPNWVCTVYNDFFLALLFRSSDPKSLTPIDTNIAYYVTSNNQRIPLSINLEVFFWVCNPGWSSNAQPQRSVGASCVSSTANQLTGTTYSGRAGTAELRNVIPVYPGEVFEIWFMVFDVVDQVYDSLVILDDFKWSSTVANGAGLIVEDPCPLSNKPAPGICGCDIPDVDTDGDGVMDCVDQCPNDRFKTTAKGTCGCGVKDIYYSGAEQICTTTSSTNCCTKSGYLGGTINWSPQTSNSLAREVQFSAEAFFDDDFWCYLSPSNIFIKCSQSGAYSDMSRPAIVGESVPALEINYGVTPSTICSTNGFSQTITSTTANKAGTWIAGTNFHYFSYTGTTTNRATYTFTPPTTGVYYVQIEVPASFETSSSSTLIIEINAGSTQTILPYKPTGPSGFRTLGSFAFSTSDVNTVVIRPSASPVPATNSFVLASSVVFTSYNPDADLFTGTFSSLDFAVYVPPGRGITVDAVSTCEVDIYASQDVTITSSTVLSSLPIRDVQVGDAKVRISSSTGSTFAFRITTTSSSSCSVTYRVSRIVPITLVEAHTTEKLIVGRATFTNHYASNSCGSGGGVTWTASFEGLARSKGYGTATTFDTASYRLEERISFNSQVRSSPQFALPSIIVRTQGDSTDFPFGINRVNPSDVQIRSGLATEFSALLYTEDSLNVVPFPSSASIQGSITSRNLALRTSAVGLGYSTVTLVATDSVTGTTTPFDVLLKIVSASSNNLPTLSILSSAKVNCPSTVTVTATDLDNDSMDIYWRPSFPYTATTTITTPTASTRRVSFSFTPTSQEVFYVSFTATDGKQDGFGYGLLTLSPTVRSCPNACSGQGTCNCDDTCTCNTRYLPPSCATYDNSAPTITTTLLTMDEDTVLTGTLSFTDSHNDAVTFSLDPTSIPASISVSLQSNGKYTITPNANYFNFNNNAVVRTDQIRVTVTETSTQNLLSSTSLITIRVNNIQDAPVVTANFTTTVNEDCTLFTGTVSATDADNDALTFTFTSSALGTFTVTSSSTGSFSYVCLPNRNGIESLTFSVSDGGRTASGFVRVTINSVNDQPTASSAAVSTDEDTPLTINLVGNDIDSSFTYVIFQNPSNGALAKLSDNSYRYTPNLNYNGADSFTFITRETNGSTPLDSAVATVSITVNSVNDAPVIGTNTYTTLEDTPITFTIAVSDVDTPLSSLRFAAVGDTTPASVTSFNALTGSVTITPPSNYFGTLSLQFTVTDQIATAVAGTVVVTVTPVNDAPTFTASSVSVNEDSGSYSGQLVQSLNLGTGETNSVSEVILQFVNTSAQSLFLAAPSVNAAGVLTFTFNPNTFGTADMTIRIRDNGGTANGGSDTSSSVSFSITSVSINDPPSFTIQNIVVNEDSTINNVFAASISPGPNESGQTVTFSVSTHTCSSLFSGTPTLTSDGRLQVSLISNANGNCLVNFTAKDNGGTSNGGVDTTTGSFTVTVNAVNDVPSFTVSSSSFTVNEDDGSGSLLSFSFATGISTGASNENDVLEFILSPTYTGNLFSTLPTISASTGQISFALAANRFGSATFTVQLRETNTLEKYYATTSPTITITVNPVNDAPDFNLNVTSLSYLEDQSPAAKSIVVADFITAGPFETQPLSFGLTHNCASSLFTVAPTITISGAQGTLSFEIAANRYLSSSCTINLQLSDGQASNSLSSTKSITLGVTGVNDAPSFTPSSLTIGLSENLVGTTPYSQSWATGISSGPFESDTVTFLISPSGTSNSGLFSTAPTIDSSGKISFVVAFAQSGYADFSVSLQDNGGTSNGGVDTSSAVTLRITVQPANIILEFVISQPTVNVDEDTGKVEMTNFITGINTPGAIFVSELTLTTQVTSGASFLSTSPSFAIDTGGFNSTGGNGKATLTFQSGPDLFGTVVVSVTASIPSRGASLTKSFSIVIAPVNDVPSFNSIASVTVAEDSGAYSLANFATNILAGPGGEGVLDSQTVSFAVNSCTNPTYFSTLPNITISSSSGTLTFTAAANAFGTSSCTVVLSDSLGKSASASLTITITPVNDPPSFTIPSTASANEDSSATTISNFAGSISAGPSNEASQTLTFTLSVTNTALFSVQPSISSSTGDLTFTVAKDVFGSTPISVTLSDGEDSVQSSFVLTVNSVNDAPTFALSTTSLLDYEDSGLITVSNFVTSKSAGPSNEASQTLTWSFSVTDESLFVKNPSTGVIFSIDDTGKLTYQVLPDVSGNATITITLSDNGGIANGGVDKSSQTVAYALIFVNDRPSFVAGNAITINEDASTTSISNWASSISKGDPLETSQTISFSVTYDTNLLSQCSIDSTGKLTLSPVANAFGSTSINITIADNLGLSFSLLSSVTVLPINDPPTYTLAKSSLSMKEDDGSTVFTGVITGMSVGPSNEVSDVASYTINVVSTTSGLLASTPSFNPSTGDITVVPNANAFGTAVISFVMSDGTDSTSPVNITITISSVNDVPTFSVPANILYVDEDNGPFSLQAFSSILSGPSNEADQTVSFIVSNIVPTGLTFSTSPSVSSTGVLTFNTVLNSNGQFTFNAQLKDNGGVANGGVDTSNSVSITVIVRPVNDLPVAVADSYTTNEDSAVQCNVVTNDSDVDVGDVVTISAITVQPSRGTATIHSSKTYIIYTPNLNYNGNDYFTYVATDGVTANSLSNAVNVTITINAVNDAPVSTPSSFSVNEDASYNVPISSILLVTDVDSTVFTYTVNTPVAKGTLSLLGGNLVYTPTPNYCGSDSFRYTAKDDGNASSNSTLVSITVNCLPDAPVAKNIVATMPENTNVKNDNIALTVVATDADVDELNLRYKCTTGPVRGTIQISLDTFYPISNIIYYTPTPWKNGVEVFNCFVQDSTGLTSAFTVSINVTGPANHVPIILDPYIRINTFEDTPGTGLVRGLDWDGTPVTYIIKTVPSSSLCSVSFNTSQNGQFIFTPVANQNGLCSFTWVVSDGSLESTSGVVEINFAPVNDVPVAQDVSINVFEEVATKGNVIVSDIDLVTNTDQLFYKTVTAPKFGVITWTNDAASSEFTYIGSKDYFGPDSFTYRVFDLANAASEIKTVNINVINVNDPPTASNFATSTDEDTPVLISLGSLVNDIDNTVSQLTFTVKSGFGAQQGTVTISGSNATYLSKLNFYGSDSFTYVVSDGQFTAEGKITVTINSINDAPVSSSDTWTMPSNSFYSDALRSFDVDGDSLTYTIITQPTKGTLNLSQMPFVTYTATTSDDPNYQATDFFEFMTTDGKLNSNVAKISINIIKTNNTRPEAFNSNLSVLEDSTSTQVLQGFDKEGAALTYFILTQPKFGTATLSVSRPGEFTYAPNANYNGLDSFTFRVKDQFYFSTSATVSITVIPVNDPPVVSDISSITDEDTPITITLSSFDVDGDNTTYVVSGGKLGTYSLSGNRLTYTPSLNLNGVESLLYKANDGNKDSVQQTITITIRPINDPPVAINAFFSFNEDTTLSGFVRSNDPDSVVTYSINTIYRDYHGTLVIDSDGSFLYTPSPNYNGNDYFLFFADDGQFKSVGRIDLYVNPVQDRPVALPLEVTTLEDNSITFDVSGSDVDGDNLSAILGDTVKVNGAKLEFIPPLTFKYTPAKDYNGVDSFTFFTFDGFARSANPATVTITITPVNDPPVLVTGVYSCQAGVKITFVVECYDVDGDNLIVGVKQLYGKYGMGGQTPWYATIAYFAWANNTVNVIENYSIYCSDSKNVTWGTADIYISPVPLNPPVVSKTFGKVGKEDVWFPMVLFHATPSYGSGGVVIERYIIVSFPDPMKATLKNQFKQDLVLGNATIISPKGEIYVVPRPDFFGLISYQFKCINTAGFVSNVGTVTVDFLPVNDPPVASNFTTVLDEDTPITFILSASDIDSSVLTYSLASTTQLQGHTYSLNTTTGEFSFIPSQNFNGKISFTFFALDEALRSAPGQVILNVIPVNDPPTNVDYQFTVEEDGILVGVIQGTDVDGDALTYLASELTPNLGNLTLLSDGTFTYQPLQNQNTPVSFAFVTSDGLLTIENQVTITITPINDPPTATNMEFTTNEDTEVCRKLDGFDIEDLTVQYIATDIIVPSHASQFYVLLDGTFCYKPDVDFSGFDYFSYAVYDSEGAFSASANVTIRVLAIYDPPQATPISITVYEDSFVDALLIGRSPDYLPITFSITKNPAVGVINITDNAITYTPYPDQNGIDLAYFSVSDGKIETIAAISIQIIAVNDPPVAKDITLPAKHLTPVGTRFDATDVDGDKLTYEIVTQPQFGTVTIQGSSFTYVYNSEILSNSDSFTYRAFDSILYSNVANVTLAPLSRDDIDRGNSNVSNEKGKTSVIGGAVGGSIAAFAAAAVGYFAVKRFNQYQESQALLKEIKGKSDFQENPLYQTLSTDMNNPLYEAPDDIHKPQRLSIGAIIPKS